MKADGTIWIDTKIDESGMEDGFNRMRDGADDVAVSFRNAGKVIEKSFSNINFNKTIENLKAQIRSLEDEFASVSREFEDAVKFDDDKAAEKLGAKRAKIYDRIARLREKLAVEVAAAASKEAAAEEKASRRVVAAEEKEAAKRKQLNNDLVNAGNSASYFGNRLRGIVSSALVFNVISSGLRSVTSYFGQALMANNQFATAVYRLKGSLMVAFQPIYESVLPALITLINWLNVAVQAVARFFSILAGKSYSQMQSNAESLNSAMGNLGNTSGSLNDTAGAVDNVGDSIKDTGKEAKKAEKYLAGFDEINRLLKDDADDLSSSLDNLGDLSDDLAVLGNLDLGNLDGLIFDSVELPTEWETAIDKLAMRFKDIFFEWDNLNPEIIAEKLLTALTTIAGGLIGFALGGPGGAVIGMIVGAGLGVVLSSLIFDGDGKLSPEELIKTLLVAIGIIGGGIIGFSLGGVGGAAIGITIGACISFGLLKMIFNNDGKLTHEEMEKSLLSVILTIGGALIGNALGGGAGALIGFAIGSILSFKLSKADFDNDGTITMDELKTGLLDALDFILPIAGALTGYKLAGGVGALVGFAIGSILKFKLTESGFENDGTITYENLEKGLLDFILPIMGALAGKALGGKAGALIGFTIGSILTFKLTKQELTAEEGAISGTEILEGIKEIFTAFAITGFTMVLGGIAGKGPGAAMGAIIGLVASFRLLGIEFGEIQLGFDGLKKKIAQWSNQTTQTVEDGFIKPTSNDVQNLQKEMATGFEQTKNSIQQNMEQAAKQTEAVYFTPVSKEAIKLEDQMQSQNAKTADAIEKNMRRAADAVCGVAFAQMANETNVLGDKMQKRFSDVNTNVQKTFSPLRKWFFDNVTNPIYELFNNMVVNIANGLYQLSSAIAGVLSSFNSTRSAVSSYSYVTTSVSTASTMGYAATPAIPQLAKGAVIPPNNRFMAILGDQKHGTNIEAPLATIQEAVALVMEDMIQSNLAGHEATVALLEQILEAVLGIELDGELLSNVVNNYNRKIAVVKGG